MKEIKVCHLTSAHKAKDDRIFVKECISLAKAGYEVYIIAPDAENSVCDHVHFLGINSFKIKSSRVQRFVKVGRLVYQKAVELDADIYHLHDPELLLYGLKLKRKGKYNLSPLEKYNIWKVRFIPKHSARVNSLSNGISSMAVILFLRKAGS